MLSVADAAGNATVADALPAACDFAGATAEINLPSNTYPEQKRRKTSVTAEIEICRDEDRNNLF